ncbi:hypothetical protein XIS1_1080017 [Xenorhabdus innexi]|uniref:Uncharacterized protein n=1 Tax=Xenorhabdus innexi TaxID=290109 RepID=A0A1N6MQN9_9GAMM|nr:hypothetical protein XIS1_1080017 [Xenorhabdus innexi]
MVNVLVIMVLGLRMVKLIFGMRLMENILNLMYGKAEYSLVEQILSMELIQILFAQTQIIDLAITARNK